MSQTLTFLDHPGRSAELTKAFDWKSSTLGEPASWPEPLKTAVDQVLSNREACNMVWGPELITFYNDAYRGYLGSQIPDGIGMPYPKFRPEVWPFVESQIKAGFEGQPTIRENFKVLTRRHGEVDEAYFTASCSLVYDESRAVAGVISHMLETTGAVRTRRALQEDNRQLRRGLNHLPHMVWSSPALGHPDFYNGPWYEFTGLPPGSTGGAGWSEVFHPADRGRVSSAWWHSQRTGEPFGMQYRLQHRDGGYRWTLGRALAERDDAGEVIRWYGTSTDIHEQVVGQEKLKSLQAKLIHLSRKSAMSSMAATLAHEVNQPLGAAANYAAGVRAHLDSGASPEALAEGVAGVENAVLRVADIIRRLRKMSAHQEPRVEPVRVASLIGGALTILNGELSGAAVVTFESNDEATVLCDPVQIQEVLIILIRNALQATLGQKEVRIAISTESNGARVRIAVEDNGPAIEAGYEDSVFDAFQPSTMPRMGIGLALSRTIVEAHQGAIRAENITPHGARFLFDLPAASSAAEARGAAPH